MISIDAEQWRCSMRWNRRNNTIPEVPSFLSQAQVASSRRSFGPMLLQSKGPVWHPVCTWVLQLERVPLSSGLCISIPIKLCGCHTGISHTILQQAEPARKIPSFSTSPFCDHFWPQVVEPLGGILYTHLDGRVHTAPPFLTPSGSKITKCWSNNSPQKAEEWHWYRSHGSSASTTTSSKTTKCFSDWSLKAWELQVIQTSQDTNNWLSVLKRVTILHRKRS